MQDQAHGIELAESFCLGIALLLVFSGVSGINAFPSQLHAMQIRTSYLTASLFQSSTLK